MIIARADSPRGEVVLSRRDDDALELRVNGVFVMDTVETSSEVALATGALALVEGAVEVLVGGLGLGFTAQALLADDRVVQVDVVELEQAVIGWMRDGTVPHGPTLLADDRLRVVARDLAETIGGTSYDLVLLDVDNGPGNLVHEGNARIYEADFLRRLRDITRGVLVIWSSHADPGLEHELREAFGNAASTECPVTLQGRDEAYWLIWAQRQDGSES